MPHKISIRAGDIELEGVLNDSPTSKLILEKMPIESSGNLWGNEIYFSIPVNSESSENLSDKVQLGDIGFWPVGKAFCIFFGPTPANHGDEIRAASKVNIFGKVIGDLEILRRVSDGEKIFVEKVE